MFNLNNFINSSKRIFTVSKKPDAQEYKIMAQVTGIGIIIVALIGFIILSIFRIIPFLG